MVTFNEHLEKPLLCARERKWGKTILTPKPIPESFAKSIYNTQKRIWKCVLFTRFCTYYVSNDGLVLSLDSRANKPEWQILKMTTNNTGRKVVRIRNKIYLVHRLVALAFVINPNPKTRIEVHHINGKPLDNRAENLMWLTPKQHRRIHAKMKKAIA